MSPATSLESASSGAFFARGGGRAVGEGLGRDDVEIVLALVRGLEVWGTRARGGASAAYWEMGQVQTEAEGCRGVGLVLLCLLRALTRAIAARCGGDGWGRWVGKGSLRKWVERMWASVVLVLEEFEDLHREAEALLREVDFCVG
jgi:hypothetical protein